MRISAGEDASRTPSRSRGPSGRGVRTRAGPRPPTGRDRSVRGGHGLDAAGGRSDACRGATARPYGAEEQTYPRVALDEDTAFAPRYEVTGKERDRGVGLVCFGARSLEPRLARWVSPDPLGRLLVPGDNNVYRYTRARPSTLLDPDGREAVVGPNWLGTSMVTDMSSVSFERETVAASRFRKIMGNVGYVLLDEGKPPAGTQASVAQPGDPAMLDGVIARAREIASSVPSGRDLRGWYQATASTVLARVVDTHQLQVQVHFREGNPEDQTFGETFCPGGPSAYHRVGNDTAVRTTGPDVLAMPFHLLIANVESRMHDAFGYLQQEGYIDSSLTSEVDLQEGTADYGMVREFALSLTAMTFLAEAYHASQDRDALVAGESLPDPHPCQRDPGACAVGKASQSDWFEYTEMSRIWAVEAERLFGLRPQDGGPSTKGQAQ